MSKNNYTATTNTKTQLEEILKLQEIIEKRIKKKSDKMQVELEKICKMESSHFNHKKFLIIF